MTKLSLESLFPTFRVRKLLMTLGGVAGTISEHKPLGALPMAGKQIRAPFSEDAMFSLR